MRIAAVGFALALDVLLGPGLRAEQAEYLLMIKNHRFEPSELTVPAGQKIQLIVDNQDLSAEKFESHELRLEEFIPGHSRARLWIGPLSPGKYPFSSEFHLFGDFHRKTAQGQLLVK
jgi:hypothetical protein